MDSDLSTWPEGLDTPLIDRKHQIAPRSVVSRMESGRARVRRLQLEPLEVVDVTWNFTADAYVTFRDFFINDLEHGSLFFSMETIEPTDVTGFWFRVTRSYAFLDGTYSFSETDNLFTVTATLEVDEEEQEEFPPRHIDTAVSDSGTSFTVHYVGELQQPPYPEFTSSLVGFQSGLYFLAVVAAPDQSDNGTNSTGFQSGLYFLTSVSITPTDDGSSLTGFQSGSYNLIVVDTPSSESGSSLSGFLSGVYTLTVEDTTHSEAGSNSTGFLSGAYTLA